LQQCGPFLHLQVFSEGLNAGLNSNWGTTDG
jgi:hypothetical protein